MTERVGIEITGDASGLTRTLRDAVTQLQSFGSTAGTSFSAASRAERDLHRLQQQTVAGYERINTIRRQMAQVTTPGAIARGEALLTDELRKQERLVEQLGAKYAQLQRVRSGGARGGGGGFLGGLGANVPLGALGGLGGLSGATLAGAGIGIAGGFLLSQGGEAIDIYRSSYAQEQFLRTVARRQGLDYLQQAAAARRLGDTLGLETPEAQRIQAQALRLSAQTGRSAYDITRGVSAAAVGAGVDPRQITELLNQLTTGGDEVTDRLVGKGPQQLYKEYATSVGVAKDRIGAFVEGLTDAEKLQIRLNAVIKEGSNNIGALSDRMNSSIGVLDRWKARIHDAYAGAGAIAADFLAGVVDPFANPFAEQALAGQYSQNQAIYRQVQQRNAVMEYQGQGLPRPSDAEAKMYAEIGADAARTSIARAAERQRTSIQAFQAIGAATIAGRYASASARNPLLGAAVAGTEALEALRLQGLSLDPELRGVIGPQAALIGAQAEQQYNQQLAGSIQSLAALRSQRRALTGESFRGAYSFDNTYGRYGQRTGDLEASGGFDLPLYRFAQQRGVYGQITGDLDVIMDERVAAIREQAADAIRVAAEMRVRDAEAADRSLLGALAGLDPRALDDEQRRVFAEASRREEERIIANQTESARAMRDLAQFVKDLQTGGTAANDALKNALRLGIVLDVKNPTAATTSLLGNGTVTRGTAGGRRP